MANYYGNYAQYPGRPLSNPQSQYGTAPTAAPLRSKVKQPSRFNFAAILICLFLPWLLFCLMYAVMSFSMHYKEKTLCTCSVLAGFFLVVIISKLAFDATMKRQSDSKVDPSWFVFLAVACFLAWLSGVVLGDLNYFYNTQAYYDIRNLNVYEKINPSEMPGQQVMDAGRLTFIPGSRLDTKKAMAFRNLDVYCVAPITSNQSNASAYDFWAVGLNCCSGTPGSYACGEFNNPHAASGLRVMNNDHAEFYRLAVQQAEATYGIKAKHPLFLYWMQDPVAEISAYMDEGYKYYLFGVFSFFAAMLFLIVAACIVFSKM